MPLTPKQQRFVEEFQIDCNGTQAAIRAGYSPKTAQEQSSRLLSNVKVREAVDEVTRARAEKLNIDAEWVLANFRNLYYEALAAGDYSTAARCLESLGKHAGIFAKHQAQKRYTANDVEKLKNDLREKGFNLDRLNDRSQN